MRRASDWELRIMHEAQSWKENCFVTLTYADENLPPLESLQYRDYQLFMKRLRKHFNRPNIRFFMCGEYGEERGRPHYHACLFNIDFYDQKWAGRSKSGEDFYQSPTLDKLWPHGRATVQPLVKQTASYCARYIMKKALGYDAETAYNVIDSDGVVNKKMAEFARMSLRPGIGSAWLRKYRSDLYPLDACVSDGTQRPIPKFYDRHSRHVIDDFDEIKFRREQAARKAHADNTDDRLRVREKVHLARVRNLKRDL